MLTAIINQTSNVADADAQRVTHALQIQVNRDFFPEWGFHTHLAFVPKGQTPPAGAAHLVLMDNSNQPGALGYHDETIEGMPIGYVFVVTTQQYGGLWTVTASHELLEMLADRDINSAKQYGDSSTFYAKEVCDAVEDDQYSYEIQLPDKSTVAVSNFQTRNYFRARPVAGEKFDFQGKLTAPFSLLPGGYMGVWKPGTGWTQVTHAEHPNIHHGGVNSRFERRVKLFQTPELWKRSTAHPELLRLAA